jgi:phosphoribosylformylglycinamidine synthase
VASKEWIIRQYDHEVQGASVVKPLLGPGEGPADATVIRGVLGRDRGIALGVGLRHRIGPLDPWQMAAGGIVEAVANVIAAGADPDRIALLDNFCWGDTRRPESLGTLVEACRACHDVAVTLAAPFVSGKDSLNNVFAWTDSTGNPRELSIPPTLLATAMGQIDDIRRVVTPDLKRTGSRLAVIGLTRDELAGSQLEALGIVAGGKVPSVHAPTCRQTFVAVARVLRGGGVLACHDVSDGGLLAALAEMAIGGRLGAAIDLGKVPTLLGGGQGRHPDLTIAFAETPCRFIVEVAAEAAGTIGDSLQGIPWAWVGEVTDLPLLVITGTGETIERISVDSASQAWRGQAIC